jgi:hypothetical protein
MRIRTRAQVAAIVVIACLAGALIGLAAAGKVGPFALLGVVPGLAATPASPAPLAADRLYPSPTPPPPVTKIVQVIDPPASSAPTAPTPLAGAPVTTPPVAQPPVTPPPPTPTPIPHTPPPTPTPRPTPCFLFCYPGDG